jgi:hypothetical protein
MSVQLRVYTTPPDDTPVPAQEPTVRVSLADLLPLVGLAHRNNYVWLQDFLDDEVVITEDLHEVIRTFRAYRPSA